MPCWRFQRTYASIITVFFLDPNYRCLRLKILIISKTGSQTEWMRRLSLLGFPDDVWIKHKGKQSVHPFAFSLYFVNHTEGRYKFIKWFTQHCWAFITLSQLRDEILIKINFVWKNPTFTRRHFLKIRWSPWNGWVQRNYLGTTSVVGNDNNRNIKFLFPRVFTSTA